MPKKIVIPSDINMIYHLKDKVDGFILGVKNLSVNLPYYLELDELMEVINNLSSKEIFVSLNKNIHNTDLEYLKEVLIKLDKTNVKGVIYYDVSIVNLKKELNLQLDLVWGQEHMTTNYLTMNYWYDFGAKYTYVSSDITLNELKEIGNLAKTKLMIQIFGYQPMFTSYRHLVKNYLKTFNIDDDSDEYTIEKEGNTYSIVDDKLGTTVYSNNILNGIEEYLELNVDYVVLNSYNIDNFEEVIDLFNSVNEDNKSEYYNKIKDMYGNVDKGFLYKETVYRVKKND